MLVCQTFTMSDLVMLLHGQHQPLGRIQPQLSQFFTQNYLNGREPTDDNIAVSTTHQLTFFPFLLICCLLQCEYSYLNNHAYLKVDSATVPLIIVPIYVGLFFSYSCAYGLTTVQQLYFPLTKLKSFFSSCSSVFRPQAAADSLVNELEGYITESFVRHRYSLIFLQCAVIFKH